MLLAAHRRPQPSVLCRLSKAKTAPEALPDSLVMAAINAGYGEGPAHAASPAEDSPASPGTSATGTLPSRNGPLAPAAIATEGGGATLPSRQGQLHLTPDQRPHQPQQQQHSPGAYYQRTSSSSSTGAGSDNGSIAACGSGRPPMPVTPAALASSRGGSLSQRAGSGRSLLSPPPQPPQQQQGRQQQQGGQRSPLGGSRQGSFRELFDAQVRVDRRLEHAKPRPRGAYTPASKPRMTCQHRPALPCPDMT